MKTKLLCAAMAAALSCAPASAATWVQYTFTGTATGTLQSRATLPRPGTADVVGTAILDLDAVDYGNPFGSSSFRFVAAGDTLSFSRNEPCKSILCNSTAQIQFSGLNGERLSPTSNATFVSGAFRVQTFEDFSGSGQITSFLVSSAPNATSPSFSLQVTSYAPEPETWAMFLLGFGAVGTAMRTRKRALAAA